MRTLTVLIFGWVLSASVATATVEIEEVTSPGGIKAWLVEDHSIPFTALEFRFLGGALLDPEGKNGVAYMMSGMLEEGAGDMDARAFAARSEALAVEFDFDGYRDEVSISARFLTENRDEAIEHLRLAIQEPRFDDDAIERVRRQILSIISSDQKDPDEIAATTFSAMAFPDHPYGDRREGTLETISQLSREDLLEAHQNLLTRDRVFVGASGDITSEELGVLLDTLFGELPEFGASMPEKPSYALEGGLTVVPFTTPQSVARFGHKGLERDDPDFFAAYVMNEILGGAGFNSRLMEEVREKRGLTYGIGSFLVPLQQAELYLGQFSSDNGRIADAITVVQDVWADFAANGVSEEELEAAKVYLTGAYPLRFDGNGRIANILVGMQIDNLGLDYIPTRNDKVRAVTVDDIKRVADRLLKPEDLHFVVVGEPEGLQTSN